MDFTFVGSSYNVVGESCNNIFTVEATTLQFPGEVINNLTFQDVTGNCTFVVQSIDGVPAPGCYPAFVPAGATPTIIEVYASTVPTYSGPLSPGVPVTLIYDDGVNPPISFPDTTIYPVLNDLISDTFWDFGSCNVGSLNYAQFTITSPNSISLITTYTVTITLINNTGGFAIDPSIDGIPFPISQTYPYPIPFSFTAPSVGVFSADMQIQITTPAGCLQSWTIPLTGQGVTPPTPPTYKSERLSIMNGISI